MLESIRLWSDLAAAFHIDRNLCKHQAQSFPTIQQLPFHPLFFKEMETDIEQMVWSSPGKIILRLKVADNPGHIYSTFP